VNHLDAGGFALLSGAGLFAGAVNAIAGGGSLISFPALLFAGYPALVANVTNTVALLPGYASGTAGVTSLLAGQRSRIEALGPISVAGSVVGAFLLTRTPSASFRGVVPWLILTACLLLALQSRLSAALHAATRGHDRLRPLMATQFVSGVYGGFFGAALGIVMLATLGLFLSDSLRRLNALKQLLSLLITLAAAAWFVAFSSVAWEAVVPIAAGSLSGGVLGALVARRLNAGVLRAAVIVFGIAIAIRLLV